MFVCTGNLCRSPMAEALLRAELARRGCDSVTITSAGTWAAIGSGATTLALEALLGRGIDLSEHRSRPLTADEIIAADLIVPMTSVHAAEVEGIVPSAAGKTRLLKEIAEIEWDGSAEEPAARLRAFLAGRRPGPRRTLDVDDPIGLPAAAYERCARELEAGARALVRVVCGP